MADDIPHIQQNKSNANEDQTTESTTEMISTIESAINTKTMLNCMQAAENNSPNALHESQPAAHKPTGNATDSSMHTQGNNSKMVSGCTRSVNDSDSVGLNDSVTVDIPIEAATTPVHIKNVDGNYLNEKVNKAEAILESDDNFLYSNHGKLLCSNLETPVLEEIHDYLDMKTDTISEFSVIDTTDSQNIAQMELSRDKRGFRKSDNATEFMANAAKRLSDEFDVDNRIYCKEQLADAEDETSLQHGDDVHDNFLPSSLQHQQTIQSGCNTTVPNSNEILVGEATPDDNSNMQMEPDTSNEHILTENVVAEIIVSSNRSSEHDETSSSSLNMLSNLKNKEVLLQEQHIEDSSSPHSSLSSSDAVIVNQKREDYADTNWPNNEMDDLTNHGDEHQPHRTIIENNLFYTSTNSCNNVNNDVQSMDAIERRDFINEQEANGSCLLGTSSLIINGGTEPRLNLDILGNTLKQQIEQFSVASTIADEPSNKRTIDNSVAVERTSAEQLTTTPTTSRTKRSRHNFASDNSNPINLVKSLEKCSQLQNESSLDDDDDDDDEDDDHDDEDVDHDDDDDDDDDDTTTLSTESSKNIQNRVARSLSNEQMDKDGDEELDEADEEVKQINGSRVESNDPVKHECIRSKATTSRLLKDGYYNCPHSTRNRLWNIERKSKSVDTLQSSSNSGNSSMATAASTSKQLNDHTKDAIDDVESKAISGPRDNEDWSHEESSEVEEICTCRELANSDGELPNRICEVLGHSKSGYLRVNSQETPTSRIYRIRKRKFEEGSAKYSPSQITNDPDKKRIALENGVSYKLYANPNSHLCTPTTSISSISRTPRSVIPTRDNPPPELHDWLTQFDQWSHVERLMAVDRLIEHCEPTQVRHMMKVIEPQFQRDFISLLPSEVALKVLSYLPPKDLLRAAQTCKSWQKLCDDKILWKGKCEQLNISIDPSNRYKRVYAGNVLVTSSKWKAAYIRHHIIEMNWRSRPIREPKVLKGHDDHVITCLQFCGNRIVSGSDDNTLKVWSAVTGKCLRTLIGHTGGVWSSQMSTNIIISGSTDRTLKVWNADNGECIHTLTGHTSTVRCMHLHEKKVVSGSRDATLRVWDIIQGRCLHTLVGHLAAVRCVQYDGKLVVSGAYDYMVKVWRPETEECLHTLQGHTNRVYSLQFDGVHVVSGSLDTSIRVWDAISGTCKHTLMGHQSLTSGMELRQNILVSGNADSTVKVWDTTNGQCLQTLSGPNKHQSAVTCLQFNSRFVITSSDDGTVKLWDVRTGEFIRNLVTLDSGGSGGVVWRIRSNDTKLICAVGSRNGTEETKLMVLDFDVESPCTKCS